MTVGILSAYIFVQTSFYCYLMIKYQAWEIWPILLFMFVCGLYFWARGKGWMEPADSIDNNPSVE